MAKTNPDRNLGARLERRAILRQLSIRLALYPDDREDSEVVGALRSLREWIQLRQVRVAHHAGGIGRR
jgi:hypothetical protein